MVAVTYGAARAAARRLGGSPAGVASKQGKGFFTRLMKAMMDARLQQAHRELALYQYLNPDETVRRDELPFGR